MEQQKDEKIIFCKGGGCTAKLGAGILSRVLERLPKGPTDENLLIGCDYQLPIHSFQPSYPL